MNQNHREFVSLLLTFVVVGLSLFIIHRFIPVVLWAAIIAVSTFPLYRRFEKRFGSHNNVAAALFTLMLGILIIWPIYELARVLIGEIQTFVNYLIDLNMHGGEIPLWMQQLPWFKTEFVTFWEENVGKPGNVGDLFNRWDIAITPASYYVKEISASLVHRSVQLGLTLLSLFFFFRDGCALGKQIDVVGEYCLSRRWSRFSSHLPQALRSIVNGTIVVGLGVGLLLGLAYWVLDLGAPVLLGFITAMMAMVPFAAPLMLIIVSAVFLIKGAIISSVVMLIWGALVIFSSDHIIKPLLIGGAVQLPFLVVLFGILGGVETLGLLGLFMGPMIMVLFITLWQEAQGNLR